MDILCRQNKCGKTEHAPSLQRVGVLLLLLIAANVSARDPYILPEHALGVRGGVTISFLATEPSITQPSMPIGMNLGLQYRCILERYFGIWLELNYDRRGFSSSVDGTTLTRTFDYVELPMLAHFTFGRGLFRFHFDLGPNIAYMVAESGTTQCSAAEHYLPVHNRFDWGVTGGIGVEFNTAHAGIYTINARYNCGFGHIFERSYDYFITSGNQNIVVNIGWMWKFRNKQNKAINYGKKKDSAL